MFREFDRILKDKVANMQLIDTKFITGNGQELTLGGQFTTYKMTNGIELTLKKCALFVRQTINVLHILVPRPRYA